MAELFLDSAIRFWVFLPIVIITFLFGVIRHHLMSTLTSNKKSDLQVMRLFGAGYLGKTETLLRAMYDLIKNTVFLGYFKVQKRENAIKNPISDPTMLTDMLKGNILNVMPMLVIGGWINWAFSGFLTTKVPFPLTHRFKPMLQRGCETLVSLDAVSSASWYFLNIFGLRSLHGLVLGSDNAADQTTMMQEQIMAPTQAPPDMQKAFKAEWEAVEVVEHNWALKCCEKKLV
ncbi:unnamed protein product [Schistocephalus solidus]|uniref:ER membrane protein complex subunit 3 n=1 Tax=Schistocephalus solidus TaxID=70667 RepID=A0A183TLU8_SCHSO|nr:unnamed protein product [Schistocephalus solidus]